MAVKTRVSSKGQVALPAALRASRGWAPGTELEVIERGDEVALRPVSRRRELFPEITLDEFFRRVPKYEGPPVTDEMIEQGLEEEAKRRWRAKGG